MHFKAEQIAYANTYTKNPMLVLSEIGFSALKHQKAKSPAPLATVQNVTPLSETEKEDFFHAIAIKTH